MMPMSAKDSAKPNTVRLPDDLQKKVEKIAEKNHLAVADVIRLCLAQALPAIEKNGLTIKPA
jgi:predicted transcriptional regulator